MHRHNTTRMTLDVPAADHKKIKAMAAVMGVSMKDFVLNCVRVQVEKKKALGKIPNELTRKVLKESEEGKNLISYDSFEDMMKDLEL